MVSKMKIPDFGDILRTRKFESDRGQEHSAVAAEKGFLSLCKRFAKPRKYSVEDGRWKVEALVSPPLPLS
jgi:hypothetical protein